MTAAVREGALLWMLPWVAHLYWFQPHDALGRLHSLPSPAILSQLLRLRWLTDHRNAVQWLFCCVFLRQGHALHWQISFSRNQGMDLHRVCRVLLLGKRVRRNLGYLYATPPITASMLGCAGRRLR